MRSGAAHDLGVLLKITQLWRGYLTDLEKDGSRVNDQLIAGYMVGAVLEADTSEALDALLDREPLLSRIFDAVSSLETPLVAKQDRSKLWAQVRVDVAALEKRVREYRSG